MLDEIGTAGLSRCILSALDDGMQWTYLTCILDLVYR